MQLRSDQKEYIKKNISRLSPDQIASDLDMPKKEVLDYLRKKWRLEKYQKYIDRFSDSQTTQSFSFNLFFWEKPVCPSRG